MPFVGIGVGIGRQRFASGIFAAYAARVAADGGTTEAGACVDAVSALMQTASLLLVPSGYKEDVVYSEIPTNGDGDLTFTRASDATRVNSDGEIEVVGSGVPRLDYSQGSCPALLLEPQRTNLVTYSEEFNNASWIKQNATIVEDFAISPNGTKDADLCYPNSDGTFRGFRQINTTSIGLRAKSIFAKQSGKSNFWIRFDNATYVTFDLENGTIFQNTTGYVATIEDYGNGWYRCCAKSNLEASTNSLYIGLADSAYSSVTVNGTDGILFWGAQDESGSYATSYIPTTSASVTRLADSFTRNNIYTNGLITSSGGTWFVELKNNVAMIRDNSGALYIGTNSIDPNSGNGLLLRNPGASNRIWIRKVISGVGTDLYQTVTDTIKVAIKWNGTSADVFINGTKQVSGTSFTTTNMEFLNLNATPVPYFIQAMQLYPTPLSDSDCTTLTTL